MDENLLSDLDMLESRLEGLAKQLRSLEERNRELEIRNAELLRDAQEARAERDRALRDAEYLAVSHKLADSPDVLVDTRRHIAQMIRNIDRCLVMLKE